MKIQIKNYIFNKTNKTVTFTDYSTIDLDSILLITNVESNTIIYNFACAGFGGTVLANVLTLDYDTSLMSDVDKLQIFYDDTAKTQATDETLTETKEALVEQMQMLIAKQPKMVTTVNDYLRVALESTTAYNYEYLSTSVAAKLTQWEGQQQSQQLAFISRPLIGF